MDDDAIFNFTHKRVIEAFFKKNPLGLSPVLHQVQSFDNPLKVLSFFENDFPPQSGSDPHLHLRNILLVDINMPSLDGFEFIERFCQILCIHPSTGSAGSVNRGTDSSDNSGLTGNRSAGE